MRKSILSFVLTILLSVSLVGVVNAAGVEGMEGTSPPLGTKVKNIHFSDERPALVIDGDLKTAWSYSISPQTLELVFPKKTRVDGVQIAAGSLPTNNNKYTVFGLQEGKWSQISEVAIRTVVQGKINITDPITVVSGEYDSIKINIETQGSWISVNEITIISNNEPVVVPKLNVESAKDKVFLNETFTVQTVLDSVYNIYAEDFNIQYDKTRFQLVKVEAANHMGLFYNEKVTDDTVRLITASLGRDHGINGKGTLVNLTFKAIGIGKGKVDATRGKIADNGITETTLEAINCGEKEIEVLAGEFSLKHLGFLGYNYNQNKSVLTDDLKALLGSTGSVADLDLVDLTKAILANPKYDFNN